MIMKTKLEDLIRKVDEVRVEMEDSKYLECMNNSANEIDKSLLHCKNRSSLSNRLPLSGSRLTLLFLLVRVIYVVNITVQLFIMYKFMFNSEAFPSLTFLNQPGHVDLVFPRNVLCYLPDIIGTNGVNSYAGQCILYLNMYNQVVYTFLYYWFILVSFISMVSIPLFILSTFRFRARIDLIKHLLKVSKTYSFEDKEIVKTFTNTYLGCDGVFLFRKLNDNVNHWIASDILAILFNDYKYKNGLV